MSNVDKSTLIAAEAISNHETSTSSTTTRIEVQGQEQKENTMKTNQTTQQAAAETQPPTDEASRKITEITIDSELALFNAPASASTSLDGTFEATVATIALVEAPRQTRVSRQRKAAIKVTPGSSEQTPKAPKPLVKSLLVTFTVQTTEGIVHKATKEIRVDRNRNSAFGDFVANLLVDEESISQFFSQYKPAMLLGKKCRVEIKEVSRGRERTLKVLEVLPLVPQPVAEPTAVGNPTTEQTDPQRVAA